MNVERFNQVLDHIIAHPETWNQEVFHCGTAHCFAGHAQIMSGVETREQHRTWNDAAKFLELSDVDSIYLFNSERTLGDFKLVAHLAKNHGTPDFTIPTYILDSLEF